MKHEVRTKSIAIGAALLVAAGVGCGTDNNSGPLGNVEALGQDPATLSISENGCVEGSVVVPNLILNGTVKGDVRVTERVELGPRARVIGNVQYRLIEMAIGAEVNGKLIHEMDVAAKRPLAEPVKPELVTPVKAAGEQGT